MGADTNTVTHLLHRWRSGDREIEEQLLAATYGELRKIARRFVGRERADHTLQATALVHEAYLRLFRDQPVDLASRNAFYGLIAQQMRRQLIDHARRRRAVKRGGHLARADFEDVVSTLEQPDVASDEELFRRLDQELAAFAVENPRAAEVLRLKFFAALSNEEIAEALAISSGTVKRDFAFARAWLARALSA